MGISCVRLDELQSEQDYERKLIIQYSENLRKSPPTKRQISHIKRLFADFGFKKITIPKFNTYAELDNWKRDKLKELINKGE